MSEPTGWEPLNQRRSPHSFLPSPLLLSPPAHPRVPAGPDVLLPVVRLRLHAGRSAVAQDSPPPGLDALPPPLILSGGGNGALHGRVLLGESADWKRTTNFSSVKVHCYEEIFQETESIRYNVHSIVNQHKNCIEMLTYTYFVANVHFTCLHFFIFAMHIWAEVGVVGIKRLSQKEMVIRRESAMHFRQKKHS